MQFPDISVLIITYDRPREIRETINSLKKHLKYQGRLLWHLADDSSPGAYLAELQRDYFDLHFSMTVTARKGWAANVNKAMVDCWSRSDYVYLNEDDYVAKRDIDLTQGVSILEADKNIGLIRYDGIAGHYLDIALREAKTPIGTFQTLTILDSSPHLNRYSNRPHLKHRRFHDKYGMYPEGLPLGKTEEAFAHKVIDKYQLYPKIAILQDGISCAFDHIGHSRQGSLLDVGFT